MKRLMIEIEQKGHGVTIDVKAHREDTPTTMESLASKVIVNGVPTLLEDFLKKNKLNGGVITFDLK